MGLWLRLVINSFLIGFMALFLFFNSAVNSVVLDDREEQREQHPKYAPGEVLVKFKEGVEPESVLKEVGLVVESIERVHSIKFAVNKFKRDYKFKKDSSGLYRFGGKQYKNIEDIPDEEIFKEAYKQMSPMRKSLYRSYKIVLPEGIGVEEAISKLKTNFNVEYAQPNYLMEIQAAPDVF